MSVSNLRGRLKSGSAMSTTMHHRAPPFSQFVERMPHSGHVVGERIENKKRHHDWEHYHEYNHENRRAPSYRNRPRHSA
jgi:hypothetical protein